MKKADARVDKDTTRAPNLLKKTFSGAGANVKGSRLNSGGDRKWRGKRGGEGKM